MQYDKDQLTQFIKPQYLILKNESENEKNLNLFDLLIPFLITLKQ